MIAVLRPICHYVYVPVAERFLPCHPRLFTKLEVLLILLSLSLLLFLLLVLLEVFCISNSFSRSTVCDIKIIRVDGWICVASCNLVLLLRLYKSARQALGLNPVGIALVVSQFIASGSQTVLTRRLSAICSFRHLIQLSTVRRFIIQRSSILGSTMIQLSERTNLKVCRKDFQTSKWGREVAFHSRISSNFFSASKLSEDNLLYAECSTIGARYCILYNPLNFGSCLVLTLLSP